MSPAMKRSVKLFTKVREAAADEFRSICREKGITDAEGIRQALSDWTAKHRKAPR